jgi:hypothetical protein
MTRLTHTKARLTILAPAALLIAQLVGCVRSGV